MDKVLVLFMGGNLCLVWDKDKKQLVYPAADSGPEILELDLMKLFEDSEVEFSLICYKNGIDIGGDDRRRMVMAVKETDANAILIIHDDDKLAESAWFIRDETDSELGKPIGFMSASKPACLCEITEDDADGEVDLIYKRVFDILQLSSGAKLRRIFGCIGPDELNVCDY